MLNPARVIQSPFVNQECAEDRGISLSWLTIEVIAYDLLETPTTAKGVMRGNQVSFVHR